jgi:hypothetical protein
MRPTPGILRLRLASIAILCALSPAPLHAQILGNATATSVQVSTLTTGVTLQVSGAVSADGRYVTMDVNPQISALEGLDTIVVPNPNGPGTILQAIGNRRIPFRPAQVGRVTFVDNDKTLLAARTPAFDLKSASLRSAVRQVADATRSNIVLGLRGLQDAGVDPGATLDFSAPAGTAKETLLALLQTAAPNVDIVITAEDKVISIATQAQADNTVVTRTYFLEDLLANVPRFVSPDTNLNEIGGRPTNQSLDFSTPVSYSALAAYRAGTSSSTAAPAKAPARTSAHRPSPDNNSIGITELITSTVRPDIWKVNGGKVGEIGVYGNRVTIRAPQSVHALLEGPKRHDPNKVSMYVGYGQ